MTLAPLIRDLAVILGVAGIVTFIFHRIRQPVVLGFILAGILVGPRTFQSLPFTLVQDLPNIHVWAELGVIFLLFSLGLEFSFRRLARVGIASVLAACFEMTGLFVLGFTCGGWLGWSLFDRVFLGALMSVSSTTLIARSLDELGLRSRRFSEVLFGILVVEDLVAVLLLTALSGFAQEGGVSGSALAYSALKLVLVLGGWFLVGFFILPRFIQRVGQSGSEEVLRLFSLGLCLLLAVMAARFQYSAALGAFIMGSILGESVEAARIREAIRPLRDLFAAIFFVSVGMLIDPRLAIGHWGAIILVSVAVLFGKSLFGTLGSLLAGQTFRTALQVGVGLSQMGELSFVIASLALLRGGSSDFLYPVAVSVSLITCFVSPFLLSRVQGGAAKIEGALPVFLRQLLSNYLSWTQELWLNAARQLPFYRLLLRWFLNGLITSVIFVVLAEWMVPWLTGWIGSRPLAEFLSWGVAVVLSAPFLWALFFSFVPYSVVFRKERISEHSETNPYPSGISLPLSRFVALLWIGFLSSSFFPLLYAIFGTALLAVLLLRSFYRQLQPLYGWFEKRFLSVFALSSKGGGASSPTLPHHLVPWDAHLTQLNVDTESETAGKKINEIGFRKRFGINIVAIQRGGHVIVAPTPEFQIFPEDKLLVLGTDEAIDETKGAVEKPPRPRTAFSEEALSAYELKPFGISSASILVNQTIRHSKIREQFGAVVVGHERERRRVVNPDPDTVLQPGDVLWMVGETERLRALFGVV